MLGGIRCKHMLFLVLSTALKSCRSTSSVRCSLFCRPFNLLMYLKSVLDTSVFLQTYNSCFFSALLPDGYYRNLTLSLPCLTLLGGVLTYSGKSRFLHKSFQDFFWCNSTKIHVYMYVCLSFINSYTMTFLVCWNRKTLFTTVEFVKLTACKYCSITFIIDTLDSPVNTAASPSLGALDRVL